MVDEEAGTDLCVVDSQTADFLCKKLNGYDKLLLALKLIETQVVEKTLSWEGYGKYCKSLSAKALNSAGEKTFDQEDAEHLRDQYPE